MTFNVKKNSLGNCNKTAFYSEQYQANAAFDIQLFKEGIPVTVYGAGTEVHLFGYFFIGHFGGGEFQEFNFSF